MKGLIYVVFAVASGAIVIGALWVATPALQASADNGLSQPSSEEILLPPIQRSSAYQLGGWCYIDCGNNGTTDYSVYLEFYTWSTCACACADMCGTECVSNTAICGGF